MKLKRYELVEIAIAANNGADQFPILDQPDLRDDTTQDIIIQGLETFSVDTMPLTPDGNAVASMDQLMNSFLVLYIDGEESVYRIPMVRLLNVFGNSLAAPGVLANFQELDLENLRIVWNKSYIHLGASFGTNFTAFSYVLGVRYKKLPPGTWDPLMASTGYPPGW